MNRMGDPASVCGRRAGSGAEGGVKRLTKRSRSATPAAEPQTEARRDCGGRRMQARDERAICGAERASAKGNRATGSPWSEANRALVTACLAVYAFASLSHSLAFAAVYRGATVFPGPIGWDRVRFAGLRIHGVMPCLACSKAHLYFGFSSAGSRDNSQIMSRCGQSNSQAIA